MAECLQIMDCYTAHALIERKHFIGCYTLVLAFTVLLIRLVTYDRVMSVAYRKRSREY